MDSFYGGKQGISFIIRDSFSSIAEMNTKFQDATYTRTWYDQYCIINTLTSNHVDNGKIFRRTGRRDKEENGTRWAEYVGRITGPAGGVPNVQLSDIENLKSSFDNLKNTFNTPSPTETIYYKNTDNNTYTSNFPTTVTTPSEKLFVDEANLIYKSGKDYAEGETPAFKYGFYTVQGASVNGTTIPAATLAIGFEIPYVDFATPDVKSVAASVSASVTATTVNNNPFYYKYTFNLPVGLPGGYITEIHSVVATSTVIYDIEKITYSPDQTPPYTVPTTSIIPTSTFQTKNILAGKFRYPVKNAPDAEHAWDYIKYTPSGTTTPTPALFYIADDPAIPTFSVDFNSSAHQFELFSQAEGATTRTSIGYVGPETFGLTATHLSGTVTAVDTSNPPSIINETISITSSPPSAGAGNLGILSSADVLYPNNGNQRNIHNENCIFLYIYENNQWHQVGQAVSNNTANINTITNLYLFLYKKLVIFVSL